MPQLTAQEVGTITGVATGIASVLGLPGVGFDKLVMFPCDVFGIPFNVDPKEVSMVLLGPCWHLNAGDEVRHTGRVMDVAVGNELLARHRPPRPTHRWTRAGGRMPAPIACSLHYCTSHPAAKQPRIVGPYMTGGQIRPCVTAPGTRHLP